MILIKHGYSLLNGHDPPQFGELSLFKAPKNQPEYQAPSQVCSPEETNIIHSAAALQIFTVQFDIWAMSLFAF